MSNINDNIFILDERQKVVGVASNGSPFSLPYYDDIHTESLLGVSTYEFSIPATHEESSKIKINGHIIRQIYNGDYVLFTIKELVTGHNGSLPEIYVYCENAAISELLEDVQRPTTHNSTSLESVISSVLANTVGWSLGYIGYESSKDIVFEDYVTVLEALRFIEKEFGVEMYFTVELVGNTIVQKKVNMVKERGSDTGVRFEYGHNLNGVSRTEDSSGIITAIIALGKGDTTSNRVNLSTVAAFDDGDFFKHAGTDWVGSEKALQQWSKDGSHIFGIFIDDEAETPARLKSVALRELAKRVVPSVMYSASVRRLEELLGYESKQLALGDRIVVLDTTFTPAIAISGRVQAHEISYTDTSKSKADLGNYKPLTLTTPAEITQIKNAISLREEGWKKSGTVIEIEALQGNVFINGIGSTTLNAKVFEGNMEIDTDGTSFTYKWYKHGEDGNRVPSWGGSVDYRLGKTLLVEGIDVDSKATFLVELVKEEI